MKDQVLLMIGKVYNDMPDLSLAFYIVSVTLTVFAAIIVYIFWESKYPLSKLFKRTKKDEISELNDLMRFKNKKKTSKKNITAEKVNSGTLKSTTKSNDMRGYKTVDGKTTSYFSRELSEQEKNLLGDCSPKRIDGENHVTDSSPRKLTEPIANDLSGASAWNQAGTFEEKDISTWTKSKLRDLLKGCSVIVGGSEIEESSVRDAQVSIVTISTITGDAVVASIRGKKKFIYDLSATLNWRVVVYYTGAGNKYHTITGKLEVSDITSDCDMEMLASNDGCNSSLFPIYKKLIASNNSQHNLQAKVKQACERLLTDIKKAY